MKIKFNTILERIKVVDYRNYIVGIKKRNGANCSPCQHPHLWGLPFLIDSISVIVVKNQVK